MREEWQDVEQIAGMLAVHRRDQLAAIHVLERHDRDFEISMQRLPRILCCSDAMRTGWTVPRMTKLTSILTSMRLRRTSSLVSPDSTAAGAWVWKPCFRKRAADWRIASLMRRSA